MCFKGEYWMIQDAVGKTGIAQTSEGMGRPGDEHNERALLTTPRIVFSALPYSPLYTASGCEYDAVQHLLT